jgi:hypothetical protein
MRERRTREGKIDVSAQVASGSGGTLYSSKSINSGDVGLSELL